MALDRREALARINNDHELFDEICGIYLSDAPKIVDKLKRSLVAGDIEQVTRHAHSLKSISANIGAHALKNAASQAEMLAKQENLQGVNEQVGQLDLLLEEVLEEIRNQALQ